MSPAKKPILKENSDCEAAEIFWWFCEGYLCIFIGYVLQVVLSSGLLFPLIQVFAITSVLCPEFLVGFTSELKYYRESTLERRLC